MCLTQTLKHTTYFKQIRLDCRIAVNISTDLDVIRWPLWNGIVIAKGLNIITKNCMIADCTKFVT